MQFSYHHVSDRNPVNVEPTKPALILVESPTLDCEAAGRDGGIVIDTNTNQIVLAGLSMPHTSRNELDADDIRRLFPLVFSGSNLPRLCHARPESTPDPSPGSVLDGLDG